MFEYPLGGGLGGDTGSSTVSLVSGTVVPEKKIPTAVPAASPEFGVLGSVVRLDGQQSSDPMGSGLTYSWSFITVPIGSMVATEGFRQLEEDGSVVSFSPDIVGEYIIGLQVSNGVFTSNLATTRVSIRAILVPHARGFIPDGKFIFKYIRDVWQQVENKELFESFFSAIIQIIGGELLKLYQVDFNKSIRDIQDYFQRRWLKYEPRLDLDQSALTFYLGKTYAGGDGTTVPPGLSGLGIIVSDDEMLVVAGSVLPDTGEDTLEVTYDLRQPSNVGAFTLFGTNANRTGYKLSPTGTLWTPANDCVASSIAFTFPFQGTVWNVDGGSAVDYATALSLSPPPADWLLGAFDPDPSTGLTGVQAGDVIWIPGGPNAGVYRILSASGTYVLVDHAPPSFQDATLADSYRGSVYRPVGYKLDVPVPITTDTFGVGLNAELEKLVAGEVVTFGTQAFEVLRISSDPELQSPMTLITTKGELVSNLAGRPWRSPHTLKSDSQSFEDLGVSVGDLLIVDVVNKNTNTVVTVPATVVGVTGSSLGFVLTDQPLQAGVVPSIPNDVYVSLSKTFGIDSVTQNVDGTLSFSGDAQDIINILGSGVFGDEYYHTPLTTSSEIEIENGVFLIEPRAIIRNRLIPIDETVRSIPALQEWIVQPNVSTHQDGSLWQVTPDGSEFPLKRAPALLVENNDYIVDDELAFAGEMSFKTGSNIVDVDDGAFIDRGIGAGDDFIVSRPITLAATYKIAAVLSQTRLLLSAPIPKYVLGDVVTAKVQIQRRRSGRFIRVIPGAYTPASPAPDRFWAEVTFFDNSENIEGNFGIAVGLTKKDLEAITTDISYRQAVAGLMYAYTQGSALNKIKLGAQVFLGLPFAEVRGLVRSIENDYRLDANGEAVEGRILIEDVDSSNNPLGTLRVYIFPIDSASELSGLDDNPATGSEYQVGDIVEQFASLSKCVAVSDYLSDPASSSGMSAIQQLQQFHSVRVRANDVIFSLAELSLLSSFLRNITPSNIAFAIVEDSEFADTVQVVDALSAGFNITTGLVDNASLGIGTELMFDQKSLGSVPSIQTEAIFTRRASGRDGATAAGSAILTSASVHMVTANGDGPVSKPSDKLMIFNGPDAGLYTISSLVDGAATVSDGPAHGFQASSGLHFALLRPVSALLRSDTATVTSGNAVVQLASGGLLADLVGPNDLIVISDGTTWHRHIVTAVQAIAGVYSQVQVYPTPNYNAAAKPCEIYREVFLTNPYTVLDVTMTVTGGVASLDAKQVQAILEPGDELVKQSGDQLHFTVLDPANMVITPVPADGTYKVWLGKKSRGQTPVGYDHLRFDPFDRLDLALIGTAAQISCTSGSTDVSFTTSLIDMQVRPGDLFQSVSGPNSTQDVGYGAGIYPVVAVLDATRIRLGVTLAETGSPTSWKLIRRR